MTELGIGRVRKFGVSGDFEAERAFRRESEAVLGGLAIDEESRATGSCGGGSGAGTVALFAHDKEEAEIARAGGEKFFCGGHHRRDNPLRVTGTAAPDEFAILPLTKKHPNPLPQPVHSDHRP